MVDFRAHREGVIAAHAHKEVTRLQRVGGRDALDVGEGGRVGVVISPEQQEIAHGPFVQPRGHQGVPADTVQRIAHDEGLPDARVVEQLHPKVVPGAEDGTPPAIPHDEREIAQEALRAVLPPCKVGA